MPISSRFLLGSLLLSGSLSLVATGAEAAGNAAPNGHVQVRGVVDSLNGNQLTITSREGTHVAVSMNKGWMTSAVVKASINDIKKGDYVGIASLPESDGGDGALEVLIFPAQLKGAGEGSFNWDLKPGSSMTNATVANAVKTVNKGEVTVTYHGHEKKIAIPEGTPVVTLAPATLDDVKPGTVVFVPAQKGADGKLSASSLIVGKNGITPPM